MRHLRHTDHAGAVPDPGAAAVRRPGGGRHRLWSLRPERCIVGRAEVPVRSIVTLVGLLDRHGRRARARDAPDPPRRRRGQERDVRASERRGAAAVRRRGRDAPRRTPARNWRGRRSSPPASCARRRRRLPAGRPARRRGPRRTTPRSTCAGPPTSCSPPRTRSPTRTAPPPGACSTRPGPLPALPAAARPARSAGCATSCRRSSSRIGSSCSRTTRTEAGVRARAPGKQRLVVVVGPWSEPAAPAAGRAASAAPLEDEEARPAVAPHIRNNDRRQAGRCSLRACSRAAAVGPAARRAIPAAPERSRRLHEDSSRRVTRNATADCVRRRWRPRAPADGRPQVRRGGPGCWW